MQSHLCKLFFQFTYLNVLDERGFEIVPVPRNKMYTVAGKDVSYSNDLLRQLVESLYQPTSSRVNE